MDSDPPFVFDLGIRNGHWHALIENASYRLQDLQRPEERVAWLAFAWRHIRQGHVGSNSGGSPAPEEVLLLVERNPEVKEAEQRFDRLRGWSGDAGIEVYDAGDAAEVASAFAERLSQIEPAS
jgi:hypothetical protein